MLFAIVTVNAIMRGKWLARQRHQMLEQERAAKLRDGGVVGSAAGGTTQKPDADATPE